jgi:hypothetical protein
MNFPAADSTAEVHLEAADAAVLHTLMYFDIFRHPLTTDEIHQNCQWHECSLTDTASALERLKEYGIISQENTYWFLEGNKNNIQLRIERMKRAQYFHRKAQRFSRFISAFPFVRAVSISGSLSKGTMDKNGDIDYFIITKPGRLWVARTFLVAFKKIFLFNSKKYFCVNYFIDSDRLTIPDRNLFVATEIAFLLPMTNKTMYEEFIRSNHWARLFYPNKEFHNGENISESKNGFIKRIAEKILEGSFGEWLDEKFLKITIHHWRKKFPHLSGLEFNVDFRSKKNVSKHHPQGFQRKVAVEMEKRRALILEKNNILVPVMRWEWQSET